MSSSSSSDSSSSISDVSSSSTSSTCTTSSASSVTSLSSSSSKSSRSSQTSGSESSSSASSSSISSESSPWDTEWFSLLYCPSPTVKDYTIDARVEVDLRHSDAVVLEALGPLTVDFGGEFGETALAEDIRTIRDGLRVSKSFDIVEDAEEWQDALTQTLREGLEELRNVYLNQYPGGFSLRHRRV